MQTKLFHKRYVDDHGETLVVREHNGSKALVDPCDESIVVVVPCGRRAKLVRYSFNGLVHGRDAHVTATYTPTGFGFVAAGFPEFQVTVQELSDGQLVDVLPASEPAAAYAAVVHPLPVLFGAAAVQPVYACAA